MEEKKEGRSSTTEQMVLTSQIWKELVARGSEFGKEEGKKGGRNWEKLRGSWIVASQAA